MKSGVDIDRDQSRARNPPLVDRTREGFSEQVESVLWETETTEGRTEQKQYMRFDKAGRLIEFKLFSFGRVSQLCRYEYGADNSRKELVFLELTLSGVRRYKNGVVRKVEVLTCVDDHCSVETTITNNQGKLRGLEVKTFGGDGRETGGMYYTPGSESGDLQLTKQWVREYLPNGHVLIRSTANGASTTETLDENGSKIETVSMSKRSRGHPELIRQTNSYEFDLFGNWKTRYSIRNLENGASTEFTTNRKLTYFP